jgi:hypothetical protein
MNNQPSKTEEIDVRAWASNIGPFDHLAWVGKDISLADMKRAVATELLRLESALHNIATWTQETQDRAVKHDMVLAQWRGCVAIARQALEID